MKHHTHGLLISQPTTHGMNSTILSSSNRRSYNRAFAKKRTIKQERTHPWAADFATKDPWNEL